MLKRLTSLLLFALVLDNAFTQETTFKTNGPDDYREGIYLFTGATIFTTYNNKIENASMLIRDGKVEDVGKNIATPIGATVINLQGKYIYPSFIDLFSDYGMPEVKRNDEWRGPQMESNIKGAYGWNQAIHSHFHAAQQFTAQEKSADELRKLGFGTVLTHRKDGIARGTGCFVTLATNKENFVVIKPYASTHYSFSKGTSTQDYPSSLMGSIALLRQTYYDALWYKNNSAKKELNLSLEEWNKALSYPQIFDAVGDWQKVLRADKVGDEFGYQYVIKTSGDEYKRINEIKNTQATVITSLNFPKAYDVEDPYKAVWVSLEEMKHWEMAPANPAALQKAGIPFCFTVSDLEKKEEFLAALRKATRYGLDTTEALKALTYTPANTIGVYGQVGSLEKNKLANFIITSRSLFDEKCDIYENWIQGIRYEVKPFEPFDIRGDYELVLDGNNHKLSISGELSALKVSLLTDTIKREAKITYKDVDVTIVFSVDKSKELSKIRLAGLVDAGTNTISGKGQLPDGNWVNWKATRTKTVEPDSAKAKKETPATLSVGSVIYPFMAYGNETIPAQASYLLRNGTIWTNTAQGNLAGSDVLIKNGKIVSVGKGLSCNECNVIDVTNKHITTGIIDEHNHIAIAQGVNEGTEASSAEVRIGDVVQSEDINIYRQLAGGVTAAQLLHGSANPIGGQSAIIKFRWGYTPEKMKIEGADGFIKFALGENVKQSNWGDRQRVRYPQTRMGVEQTYYNYFTKAREYDQAWSTWNKQKVKSTDTPRRDLELDALVEILQSKRFITCHSYVQSEINMLMHVADSFKFKVNTFTHILEGYKVADKMKAHGVYASTFADWWAYKYEVIDAIPYNTALLTKMGICTAVNSDDAEMARRLNQEAAKAVKYGGLSETEAWKTVTLNPAIMLHLDHRTGSVENGKDADIVVWSDNPLSIYAVCEKTFVDGTLFYDLESDRKKREEIKTERARLIQKMLDEKKAGAPTQEPIKKDNKAYTCGDHDHDD